MAIETRTFDEMYALGRALLVEYLRDDGADVSDGSDYDITARLLAAMFLGNQGQVEELANQLFPEDAAADFLERYRERYRLADRSAPTAASGTAFFTASSGQPTLEAGQTMEASDGTIYTVRTSTIAQIPGWSGKTVVEGSSRGRVLVAPDATDMEVGQVVEINGERRTILGKDDITGTIDLSNELPWLPAPGLDVLPVTGAEVTIDCGTTGEQGMKPRHDRLTVSSAPSGVDTYAYIVSLSNGSDGERIEDLRARVVAHEQNPPSSGNAGHYRRWTVATPDAGAIDALIYPGFRGLGTVDIIPVGPTGARVLSQAQVDLIQANVDALKHPADDVLVRRPILASPTEVQLVVTYETGFEPDWTGSFEIGPGGTTTRIPLLSSPIGTIKVGNRVMVDQVIGVEWFTFERTVSVVTGSYIEVDEPFPVAVTENPQPGRDSVYPGSPNAMAIVEAIESVFDALGAGIGTNTTAIYMRDPLPSVGWDPVLRTTKLEAAVVAASGVRDVALTTVGGAAAADITPDALVLIQRGQIRMSFTQGI